MDFGEYGINEKIYTDSSEFVADKKAVEKKQIDDNKYEFIQCVWRNAETGKELRCEIRDLNPCGYCSDMTHSLFISKNNTTHTHYTGYELCEMCNTKMCNQCIYSKDYCGHKCYCEDCYDQLMNKE